MTPHPAPLAFTAMVLLRGLSFLAASAPARARAELAPLRLGVWVDRHLMCAATGPLMAALAGWLTALLDLLPRMPAETRSLHGAVATVLIVSLFVNYCRVVRTHPGPVESAGSTARGGPGTTRRCDVCNGVQLWALCALCASIPVICVQHIPNVFVGWGHTRSFCWACVSPGGVTDTETVCAGAGLRSDQANAGASLHNMQPLLLADGPVRYPTSPTNGRCNPVRLPYD